MHKWSWRICVTSSLLLLAGTLGIWARAQWARDELSYAWIGREGEKAAVREVWGSGCRSSIVFGADSDLILVEDVADARAAAADPAGTFGFKTWHESPWSYSSVGVPAPHNRWGWMRWGLGWEGWSYRASGWLSGRTGTGGRAIGITGTTGARLCVPWWFLALLFALAPARALWAWRGLRRRPPYACPGCGYDLRGGHGRCPECGTAVPASVYSASAQTRGGSSSPKNST